MGSRLNADNNEITLENTMDLKKKIRDHWLECVIEETHYIISIWDNSTKADSETSFSHKALNKALNVTKIFQSSNKKSSSSSIQKVIDCQKECQNILTNKSPSLVSKDIVDEKTFTGKKLKAFLHDFVNPYLQPAYTQLKIKHSPSSCIVDRFIRHLNNGTWIKWETIKKELTCLKTEGLNLVTSVQYTPINECFLPELSKYKKTGLSSMTGSLNNLTASELTRVINYWTMETKVVFNHFNFPIFQGFRSASVARVIGKIGKFSFVSEEKQKNETIQNFLIPILYKAASRFSNQSQEKIKYPKFAEFPNSELVITSIILQSDGIGNEGKMIKKQEEMLMELNGRKVRYILDELNFPSNIRQKISAVEDFNFKINIFKDEVNARGGYHFFPINKESKTKEFLHELMKSGDLDEHNLSLFGDGLTLEKARVGQTSSNIHEFNIPELFRRTAITAIYKYLSNQNLKNLHGSYKEAAMIALGGFLSHQFVHFNCKSGKDRTGFLTSEIIFLAYTMFNNFIKMFNIKKNEAGISSTSFQTNDPKKSYRLVPNVLREEALNNFEQFFVERTDSKILYEIMKNSGNFEIQELSTGVQGYKVAPNPRLFSTDKKYRDRIGGDSELKEIWGLKNLAGYHEL